MVETFPHWGGGGRRVAAPTGGGGEECRESGGSGVGRRAGERVGTGCKCWCQPQVFARDGSGEETAAAALAQPARLDPRPPTSQPRQGEEGGCRLRGGPGRAEPGATSVWGPARKGVAGGRTWGVEE